jgi:zinc protease
MVACHPSKRVVSKVPTRRSAPVHHLLDNGLQVLLLENHTAPVVAIQMWVNVGSADDPEDASGMAHVLEHMVFKGTKKRSEGQIAMEIEGSGGQINAWTSFDQTVFHVVLASRFYQRGLEILADTIQNTKLDEEDLSRELDVIMEEVRQGEDSPTRVVSRNLFATAYNRHPYRRPVIGHAQTIQSMSKEGVESFYNTYYVPTNMTLVVAGDFKASAALRRIGRLFNKPERTGNGGGRGEYRAQALRRSRPEEPSQRRMRVRVEHRETQEAYVTIGFHIPGLMHADTPALDLAAVILGQGECSRLTRKLKQELQLVTTSYAYAYTPKDPGLLVIGATCSPKKLLKAVEAIVAEAMALGVNEVTAAELQRAKTMVESDGIYQKETVQGQARKLGFFHVVAGDVDFERGYNRRIAAVTSDQLRQVSARYLHPSKISLSVITPEAKGRERAMARDIGDAVRLAQARVVEARRVEVKRDAKVVKVTLGNGARLLVLRDSSVPLAAVRVVWTGGLRYETPANNGVNSLLAALITRGTTTRSGEQINETIEGMAGSIGGFSGQNSFGLRGELLARYWEQGLEIMADCLLNPAFAQDQVERERRALLDDILAQQDNLSAVVMRLFNRTMYKRHPYRLNLLGTSSSVASITREQLVKYFRRHYQPSNMVLSVVGDVDPKRVKEKFKQLFGGAPGRKVVPISVKADPQRSGSEEAIELVKKHQAHMVVGYPGTSLRGKDRFALEVLSSVLSGQGGRLFVELRDRQGLAYQVGAFSQEGLEPGYFAIFIATGADKLKQALDGIEQQVKLLRDQLVSSAELSRVKRYLVGSYEISLQRRSTVASYLAFNECYGLGYKAYTRYAPSILAVTAEEVQRVARKYLNPKRRVVAVVMPEELSPGAQKRLGPIESKQAGRAVRKDKEQDKAGKRSRSRSKRKRRSKKGKRRR